MTTEAQIGHWEVAVKTSSYSLWVDLWHPCFLPPRFPLQLTAVSPGTSARGKAVSGEGVDRCTFFRRRTCRAAGWQVEWSENQALNDFEIWRKYLKKTRMVFFTCNGCGESVKKAQVEKHFNICRGCTCLSCIDCGKDFWGNDYKTHTKCITEDQKYGGKGFDAKAKKGDIKQQQWIQKIQETMNDLKVSPSVREILKQMNSCENIPRKKLKFQNWMKNSLNVKNVALQEQVWEIFAAAISNDKISKPQSQKHTQKSKGPAESIDENSDQTVAENNEKIKNKRQRKEERKKKSKKEKKLLKEDKSCLGHKPVDKTNQLEEKEKKKRKKNSNRSEVNAVEENETGVQDFQQQNSENLHGNKKCGKRKNAKLSSEGEPKSKKKAEVTKTEEVEENAETKPGKFNWKRTIKIVLQQSPEHEISIKKLRKKVLSHYYAEIGDNNYKSEEDLMVIFLKKINSNPKFKVLKDKVKLVK